MSWRIPEGRKKIRSDNISRSMKVSAEARKCPKCERKGAMVMRSKADGSPVWQCRYCEHIKKIEVR